MSKNVKANANAKRYMILVDCGIYRSVKSKGSAKGYKWYQYINEILAKEVGMAVPDYLKPDKVGNKS